MTSLQQRPEQVLQPVESGPQEASRTFDLAVAFIQANVCQDVGLDDIAQAACVTPRAVQLAFRKHLETTPMAYLRDVRLVRARQQLATSDSGSTSVTEVAMQWGFYNAGRFAAAYRSRFGELPRDTLRTCQ